MQRKPHRGLKVSLVLVASLLATDAGPAARLPNSATSTADGAAALPQHLADTGLFVANTTTTIRPGILTFSPQYPLWSDGTSKRRWIRLPPGTAINASRPDAWEFPPGTRLWKEFSHGRPIETRFIERLADGSWRYATYVWNADGSDAVLAPSDGIRAMPVAAAPKGNYTILSESDCRACHEGAAVPVLGFSALQLSPDRDPLAPHSQPPGAGEISLNGLVASGYLRGLPPTLLKSPPRIAASTATARAALGYLHSNCGHCHNRNGNDPLVPVNVSLAQSAHASPARLAELLESVLGAPSRYRMPGAPTATLVVSPREPANSVLALRMRSRNPQTQMPPLGTQIPDTEGIALIERWIDETPLPKESKP